MPSRIAFNLPPIVHRDDHLVVLDKPAGLLSVPGIGAHKQDCLASRVRQAIPGALIVHRLDRDTSGVIVMALDPRTHRELSRQFHDREVEKLYLAVVAGRMEKDAGTIDLPMRKDLDAPRGPRHIIDFVHGRPAITHWRACDQAVDRARLELRPLTGRSHQLRLHLQAIGHPILGDDLYAPPEIVKLSSRLLLHALSLSFTHPATGQQVTFTAPCPF